MKNLNQIQHAGLTWKIIAAVLAFSLGSSSSHSIAQPKCSFISSLFIVSETMIWPGPSDGIRGSSMGIEHPWVTDWLGWEVGFAMGEEWPRYSWAWVGDWLEESQRWSGLDRTVGVLWPEERRFGWNMVNNCLWEENNWWVGEKWTVKTRVPVGLRWLIWNIRW